LPEEGIVGGDDVLDRRTGPGLEIGDGVNEHALVGDQVTGKSKLGKRSARGHALLENGTGLDIRPRRQ
jgi:hypothetical protein